MTTDHDDLIREAEEKLAEANADVARLRAQLADEQAASAAEPAEPHLLTWEDGVAAARKRHPAIAEAAGKAAAAAREAARPKHPNEPGPYVRRTPAAAYTERNSTDPTPIAGARAEAQRRGALRKGGSR